MNARVLLAAVVLLPSSACYRITVVTGAAPAPETVSRPWQLSWVSGLVPPPELNVKEACPQGVARVQTQRSFLNGLVSSMSNGILTPMSVKVTCAAGSGTGRAGGLPESSGR